MYTCLIKNGIVMTMDGASRIYNPGGIFLEDDRIAAVGPIDQIHRQYSGADEIIDAQGQVVLPGLINAHCHTTETGRRFLGADKAIMEWLQESKFPYHAQITPPDAEAGAIMGIMENLRFGNTTIIDNYYPPAQHKEST